MMYRAAIAQSGNMDAIIVRAGMLWPMDALVRCTYHGASMLWPNVRSGNTDVVIIVRAWRLWPMDALVTGTYSYSYSYSYPYSNYYFSH